jgi:DNA-binding NarL/FixJ family response regulator
MTARYSIVIADDHELVRAGIRSILLREPDMDIVGEAATGEEAVQIACAKMPDVVMMDLSMPGRGGLFAMSELRSRAPSIKVLALSMHNADEYIQEALRNGAAGYILKDSGHEELVLAIRRVLTGKIYLSPDVAERVISNMVFDAPKPVSALASLESLSARELQVLKLVAQGEGNKQVADKLHLSIKTVEKHRASLMRKLGLRNSAMLVSYAISHGLVSV